MLLCDVPGQDIIAALWEGLTHCVESEDVLRREEPPGARVKSSFLFSPKTSEEQGF